MAKLIRILLAVIVGLVLIVFAVVNRDPVEVSFYPFPASLEAPLVAVALVFLFLGVLAGGFVAWLNAAATRRRNRELRRRNDALDTQVRGLRRQLAEVEDRSLGGAATPAPPAPGDRAARAPALYRPGRDGQQGAIPQPLLVGGGGAGGRP